MSKLFWLRRFLLVFGVAFMAIISSHLLRGYTLEQSLTQSSLWAMISAFIFVISRIYQSRKGQHCGLCNDIPEHRESR